MSRNPGFAWVEGPAFESTSILLIVAKERETEEGGGALAERGLERKNGFGAVPAVSPDTEGGSHADRLGGGGAHYCSACCGGDFARRG
jgi:hypothetical protein